MEHALQDIGGWAWMYHGICMAASSLYLYCCDDTLLSVLCLKIRLVSMHGRVRVGLLSYDLGKEATTDCPL